METVIRLLIIGVLLGIVVSLGSALFNLSRKAARLAQGRARPVHPGRPVRGPFCSADDRVAPWDYRTSWISHRGSSMT